MRSCLLIYFYFFAVILNGQVEVSNNFNFNDGFYTSFNDFNSNSPPFKLSALSKFDFYFDGDNNILFLNDQTIKNIEASSLSSIDSVWGVCVGGIPYKKIAQKDGKNSYYFVKFHIVGRICYLYFPSIIDKQIEMQVYNPFNGVQVGKKTITNKEKLLVKKIMKFNEGKLIDFNADNFYAFVKNDSRLVKTISSMRKDEIEEKLFKLLKIYNDRNPIKIE